MIKIIGVKVWAQFVGVAILVIAAGSMFGLGIALRAQERLDLAERAKQLPLGHTEVTYTYVPVGPKFPEPCHDVVLTMCGGGSFECPRAEHVVALGSPPEGVVAHQLLYCYQATCRCPSSKAPR